MKWIKLFENWDYSDDDWDEEEDNDNYFYHGSSIPDITEFRTNSERFSLLGEGVYTYKKIESAEEYGDYIYRVDISYLRIAPIHFMFNENETEEFRKILGIPEWDIMQVPIGVSSPIWWATDGFDWWNINRSECVGKLKDFMVNRLGYDGMLVEYGRGGLVCVIWNYGLISPELIEDLD